MGADRHEAERIGVKPKRQRHRFLGPPKDDQWMWMPREMLNSVAWRALSGNAMKVIFRLAEEHLGQGGLANGRLIVTHKQFAVCDIREASLADAILEAEYYGFVRVDRGIAYKGGHEPNIYRLTWIGDFADAPPTNEWKAITQAHVTTRKENKRIAAKQKRSQSLRRKQATAGKIIPLRAS